MSAGKHSASWWSEETSFSLTRLYLGLAVCMCDNEWICVSLLCCARSPLQVRLAGGIDVLTAILKQRGSKQQQQQQLGELAPLVCSVLGLLSVLVEDNSANKLSLREAGGFECVAVLLDRVLKQGVLKAAAAAAAG